MNNFIVNHCPGKGSADMIDDKKDYRAVLFATLWLILIVVVVYMKVQKFDFVGYDDELYVTENHYVQEGISAQGIKWAFTTFHSANWHPLTWISHMLDCELYGLNPAGHHWTNVEFHIANTILLFFILFKMTGAIWRSAFVAALFALHPLHVESVAWISERKDVLSTFFGLLTIAAYYRYVKKYSIKCYILVLTLLSLSLMAKPMLVTMPFVLLLMDFWPLKRVQFEYHSLSQSDGKISFFIKRHSQLILEKTPLFILVVISCIVTFFAQKNGGAVKSIVALPVKYRIENAVVSYVKYVLKMFWPSKLAVFYPHPGNTLLWWQIVGAAFVIVAACFWAIRAAKKYPYIVIGLFWYLGTLVPVVGLIQVGDQAMADRYTYIPLIGVFIIVAWGVSDLFKKWPYRKIYLSVFVMIILSALIARTSCQISHWKNGVTLFEHAVKVTENNYIAHNNLATALGSIDLDRAISHYKEALRIHPKYVIALGNLGLTLNNKGNYDEAVLYFTKALKIDPQKTDIRMDLANVFFLQAKPEKAISQYQKILQNDSENADAHYNLAYVLSSQNKTNEAVLHYNETLKIDPKYSKAYYNLGNILLSQGKVNKAATLFIAAIKFNPDYAMAYNKLGSILFRQRKFSKSKVLFSKAIKINSKYSEAHNNLDIVQKIILSR